MTDSRIALVSGANRGIGLEIARQLAAAGGHAVVLGARDEAAAQAAAGKIGGDSVARQLDVTDEQSVARLAASLEQDFGRLDVLVNNAGVMLHAGAPGLGTDLDEVRQTLETNLLGAWRLANAIVPLMQRGGWGRIVNISSGMGQLSDMNGGTAAYRVSKTALNALTRILAAELADSGILVNSACPGWVRTDMGSEYARLSVEEGADTPVWLATLPDDGPTGGFFRAREPIPW
ncbi:MAG TPA: SDR family oxidoreductase [Solirubrobacteraceae bacterium]|nr:SDR family oxidoreductase [Solirubrobacteraceae bacterium]